MRNAGLEETQAGIKIAGRNINNHRYRDDTTLMAESEEELKGLLMKVKSQSEVAQSCPTLRNPMDCSPPGSSIHGIFQARVLEWGAIAFSGSVTQSYPILRNHMDCSTPGFPVHHHLPEPVHVHGVSDGIQLSHPLSSPSPPAFYLSQHQNLF